MTREEIIVRLLKAGWEYKQIASQPEVNCNVKTVERTAKKHGLSRNKKKQNNKNQNRHLETDKTDILHQNRHLETELTTAATTGKEVVEKADSLKGKRQEITLQNRHLEIDKDRTPSKEKINLIEKQTLAEIRRVHFETARIGRALSLALIQDHTQVDENGKKRFNWNHLNDYVKLINAFDKKVFDASKHIEEIKKMDLMDQQNEEMTLEDQAQREMELQNIIDGYSDEKEKSLKLLDDKVG